MPFGVDPVILGLVGLILLFVFAVYLFFRRTVLGFREGVERGRR